MQSLALRETQQNRKGGSTSPYSTTAALCNARFAARSQQNPRAPVYRLGTLAESERRSAVQPTAAQRPPAAVLDPFSLGSARKGQSGHVFGPGPQSQSPCVRTESRFRHLAAYRQVSARSGAAWVP